MYVQSTLQTSIKENLFVCLLKTGSIDGIAEINPYILSRSMSHKLSSLLLINTSLNLIENFVCYFLAYGLPIRQ